MAQSDVDRLVHDRNRHASPTAFERAIGRSKNFLRYLRDRAPLTGYIPPAPVINAMARELVNTEPLEVLLICARNAGVRMPPIADDYLFTERWGDLGFDDQRDVLHLADAHADQRRAAAEVRHRRRSKRLSN